MKKKGIVCILMAGCLSMTPMVVHGEEVLTAQTALVSQTTDLLNAKFVFTKAGYVFEKSVMECVTDSSDIKTNMDIYKSLTSDSTKMNLYFEALNQVLATIPEKKMYFVKSPESDEIIEGTAIVTFRINDTVKQYINDQLVKHVAGAEQGDIKINLDDLELNAYTAEGTELTGCIATLMGEYTTSYRTSSAGRCTNIQIAADNLNGTYVQPGETISVSTIFKPRNEQNGYQMAGIFLNGETVPGMGGGICQVSTTTYVASLNAGMTIVERHQHSLPVSYVPAGMDATISGMALDLKIKNDFMYPVYYKAFTQNKTVTIQIYHM